MEKQLESPPGNSGRDSGDILPARRKGIVTMAVAFADLAITPVDQQFRVLVLCDPTGGSDGFALRTMNRRGAGIAFASNGPATIVRDDMLVLTFGHVDLLRTVARMEGEGGGSLPASLGRGRRCINNTCCRYNTKSPPGCQAGETRFTC